MVTVDIVDKLAPRAPANGQARLLVDSRGHLVPPNAVRRGAGMWEAKYGKNGGLSGRYTKQGQVPEEFGGWLAAAVASAGGTLIIQHRRIGRLLQDDVSNLKSLIRYQAPSLRAAQRG